jgi:hypothetical protein
MVARLWAFTADRRRTSTTSGSMAWAICRTHTAPPATHPAPIFCANRLDAAIIDDRPLHAIPYTTNNNGDYAWINVKEGFGSVAAWYIFAKQGFNPLLLKSGSND